VLTMRTEETSLPRVVDVVRENGLCPVARGALDVNHEPGHWNRHGSSLLNPAAGALFNCRQVSRIINAVLMQDILGLELLLLLCGQAGPQLLACGILHDLIEAGSKWRSGHLAEASLDDPVGLNDHLEIRVRHGVEQN
jgi:hypothetical protein